MLRKESQKTRSIICVESTEMGIKEQLKNLSNVLKQKLPLESDIRTEYNNIGNQIIPI